MRPTPPQELIFTLYGDFLLHRPGPVWVGSVIALLGPLGLSETNVRTVLSRMTGKGWLEAERHGRRSYYALTGRGRRLLEEGETRIYEPRGDVDWDGEWTILAYSIPEHQRRQRDRLRIRLEWLGFGSLGNGLWLTPHDVAGRVRELAQELGVAEYVELFRGPHLGVSDVASLVARCWDLASLNESYGRFIDDHLDRCREVKSGGPDAVDPRTAYVRRFNLVHEFRQFPLRDPFLPRPLQPENWAGECALALFNYYRDLLAQPADDFVESIVETPTDRRSGNPAATEEEYAQVRAPSG